MSDPTRPEDSARQRVISRWENEGGAESDGPQLAAPPAERASPGGPISAGEWTELKTRVIALENLVIALLKTASADERALARQMAEFILPRPGATHHRLTVHAAHRMGDLIDRAERFERPAE
ncbi:MAG TPA: hypothetical protein VII63_09640 [Caulobacteraceae bacterium]